MPLDSQKIPALSASRQRNRFGTKGYQNILQYFRKTPMSISCPHFWELRWAYGCPFDCAYCYLQGTLRGKKEPRYVPLEHILIALDDAFKHQDLEPSIFNSGELADSLMNPSMMEKITDKFEEQTRHKLLILTKSANVKFLVRKPRKQTIVSFSLNNSEVWQRWEHKTPPPEKRIEAAKELDEAGYEVRIRLDPVIPIKDWQYHYQNLLNSLFRKLCPERITIGMPRGLQKTLMFSKDLTWAEGLTEKSGWGWKLPTELRRQVYLFFIENLRASGFDTSRVALCKETTSLVQELGMAQRCNCVW